MIEGWRLAAEHKLVFDPPTPIIMVAAYATSKRYPPWTRERAEAWSEATANNVLRELSHE